MINIISLYIAIYLSMLVDALKIFLLNLYYIYNLVKLIIKILAIIYIDLNTITKTKELIDLLI